MTSLLHYVVTDSLYESEHSRIYRAYEAGTREAFVLKILNEEYPSPETVARFRREYEITRSLHQPGQLGLPGVIRALGWERYQHTYLIVVEDYGGISLDRFLHENGNHGKTIADRLALFFPLAIQVTEALGMIHARRVIHKDLNPANILYHPQTGQTKIIDFSISNTLTQENPAFHSPEVIEGTLPYISPEQTGRMNRAIDYRTDFYSLGMTFYELLTGQPAFVSADDLEVMHSHIARQPVPPHQRLPEIPLVLSDLVMKLLSKDVEQRYQSTHGLLADLKACQQSWSTQDAIPDFTLAQQDLVEQFKIPQKLYGREILLQQLLNAFEWTSQGEQETMLITGPAGIGKTALVQELYRPITQRRGYFVSGKFEQYRENVPYAAFRQAFHALTRLLLTEKETKIATLREQIQKAVEPNGQVLLDVLPELALLIGPQPPVPALLPAEAQQRFMLTLVNFIQAVAHPDHPLVIFLDDIQWVDAASAGLITRLSTDVAMHYLLLICAYRDTEAVQSPLLSGLLKRLQPHEDSIRRLRVEALELPHLVLWLVDMFHCDVQAAAPLADLLYAKTGGNPFFVSEFLKNLGDEKRIWFDAKINGWRWNLEQIWALNISSNIVDLMTGKVQKLDKQTQAVLKIAACLGNVFNLEMLALSIQQTPRETALELRPAIADGLLLPMTQDYSLFFVEGLPEEENERASSIAARVEYKFAHDRIQQAVYALLTESEKEQIHWQVGSLLLAKTPTQAREEQIFVLVAHLNAGQRQITTQAGQDELAGLNLLAGQRAKRSSAYPPALDYFQRGIQLLGEGAWSRQYALALALHEGAVEAAYLSGQFELMAPLFEQIQANAHSDLEKAGAYNIMIQANVVQNRLAEAVQMGLDLMNRLDAGIPAKPNKLDVILGLARIKLLLAGKSMDDLLNMPVMTDPNALAVIHTISTMGALVYNLASELLALLTFRSVELSVRYGSAEETPQAYVSYGLILCNALGDIEGGYAFGQLGQQLLDHLRIQRRAQPVAMFNFLIRQWKEPLRDTLPALLEAHQIALETGSVQYLGVAVMFYCSHSYLAGKELTALEEECSTLWDVLNRFKLTKNQINVALFLQSVQNLLGKNETPYQLIGERFNETEMLPQLLEAGNLTSMAYVWLNRLMLCYLFGEVALAVEAAQQATQYLSAVPGNISQVYINFFDSLAHLALASSLTGHERIEVMRRVKRNQKKLKRWAKFAPANDLHKYWLVEAELARVTQHRNQAETCYDRAIELARKNEYIHEEALAYELAGQYYTAQGLPERARYSLTHARDIYQQWGAAAKVSQLESRYPYIFTNQGDQSGRVEPKRKIRTTDQRLASSLDLASVLKAAQAISREIVFSRLVEKFMDVLMENAGVQRGFLILETAGQLRIEARRSVDAPNAEAVEPFLLSLAEDQLAASMVTYVVRAQQEALFNLTEPDPLFAEDRYISRYQPKSILCLPILSRGNCLGALYLENSLAAVEFKPARVELLRMLTSQGAVAIENARVYADLEHTVDERTAQLKQALGEIERAAVTDQLTGAYNRRKFDEIFDLELKRAERHSRPISMIMIDLDQLKWVNDTYGHVIGDEALCGITQAIQANLRSMDTLARWGGDEFVILSPETDLAQAAILAERIREMIEQIDLHGSGQITASLGLAQYRPGERADEFFQRTDQAMFNAKKQGRNRVVSEDSGM